MSFSSIQNDFGKTYIYSNGVAKYPKNIVNNGKRIFLISSVIDIVNDQNKEVFTGLFSFTWNATQTSLLKHRTQL